MSQFDDIAATVVRSLASTATGTRVVADAFRLGIAAEEQFNESSVAIEKLEFAAFAVGGLAATAVDPVAGQVRASSRVELPLSDSAGGSASPGQTITLFGPGDVRGIDRDQIIRRYPAPGTLTAEETVLAHIEFDRPELPWQFSAARAGDRLRPWLTLVVVEQAAVQWEPATALLPILRIPLAQLPRDLGQAHLWAHAQAPQSGAVPLEVRLSPEYAPVNLSRLLSPRVLKQDTDYVAALVPTTDAGVRAGLGTTGGTLDWAWSSGSTDPVRLPVYDSWTFRTGPDGDFRSLALRLNGVVAPYEVGRRFIACSEPGKPLASLPEDAPGALQVLRCALYSTTPPPPERVEVETAAWPESMVEALRTELDLPARVEGSAPRTDGVPDLPIVGPRLYGGFHRGSATVTGNDWFAQLNLGPVQRVMAGLGTRVVQRDQEQLMQSAWAQVGEIEKANRAILLAQFAELVATRFHDRLSGLQQGRLLQVAAPLATRVSLNAGRTLSADVAASATAPSALAGAFRRASRPAGPMLRRANPASRARVGELAGTESAMRDFTRLHVNPDGIGRLDAATIGLLDSDRAATALGVTGPAVGDLLARAGRTIDGGLATYLTSSSRWRAPQAGFDLGAQLAEDWGERLLRVPPATAIAANPAITAVREQRVAPLLAELATFRVGGGGGGGGTGGTGVLGITPVLRERLEARAIDVNNGLITRLGAVGDRPVDGAIRDRNAELRRGSAIGGAVGGPGTRSGRLTAARAGRITSRIQGLTAIDAGQLTRITTRTSVADRRAALDNLATLATRPLKPVIEQASTVSVDTLRTVMTTLVDPGSVLAINKVPRRKAVAVDGLVAALAPSLTVRSALQGRLHLSEAFADRWQLARPRPIMAAPRFDRPMYEALNDYDRDWLVPGLGLLPADDFVTVLSTNSEFTEAFLVGLSDEMGRELHWRNYPTDRRGTYFHRFWDADEDELRQPIHAFSRTGLGRHLSIGGAGGPGGPGGAGGSSEPRAVIVVKSELVRRFPDLVIQAVKNQAAPGLTPVFEKEGSPQQTARQLFSAFLEPDIALIGVDLGLDEIDRPEWWILIAEHPGATRFERAADGSPGLGQFISAGGAGNGAALAAARLHDPTRVAFQATDLVKRS